MILPCVKAMFLTSFAGRVFNVSIRVLVSLSRDGAFWYCEVVNQTLSPVCPYFFARTSKSAPPLSA